MLPSSETVSMEQRCPPSVPGGVAFSGALESWDWRWREGCHSPLSTACSDFAPGKSCVGSSRRSLWGCPEALGPGHPRVPCELDSAPLVETLFPRPCHSQLALPAAHSAWGLPVPCLHVRCRGQELSLPSIYADVIRVGNWSPHQLCGTF